MPPRAAAPYRPAMKRKLTLRRDELTELSSTDLTDVAAGVTNTGALCPCTGTLLGPTIPDINRCPTLLC